MKPTRFVILFILMSVHFAVQSQKQEYKAVPFPMEDGAIWSEYAYPYQDSPEFYNRYMLNGDTLIGDTLFKKLFWIGRNECEMNDKAICKGWLWKQSERIYYKNYRYDVPEAEPTQLLYDFTLQLGDSVELIQFDGSPGYYEKVEKVDTLVFGNQLRRVLYFSLDIWIEGIGNQKGLLDNFEVLKPSIRPGLLNGVVLNGENLYGPYRDDDNCFFSGLYPAESTVPDYEIKSVSGHIEIRFTGTAYESVSVVDMQGKVLNQIKNENKEYIVIPTTGYAKGLYLLLLERGDKRSVSKVAI